MYSTSQRKAVFSCTALRLKTVERKSDDKTKIVLSSYLLKKIKIGLIIFLVFLFILSKSFITININTFSSQLIIIIAF